MFSQTVSQNLCQWISSNKPIQIDQNLANTNLCRYHTLVSQEETPIYVTSRQIELPQYRVKSKTTRTVNHQILKFGHINMTTLAVHMQI